MFAVTSSTGKAQTSNVDEIGRVVVDSVTNSVIVGVFAEFNVLKGRSIAKNRSGVVCWSDLRVISRTCPTQATYDVDLVSEG